MHLVTLNVIVDSDITIRTAAWLPAAVASMPRTWTNKRILVMTAIVTSTIFHLAVVHLAQISVRLASTEKVQLYVRYVLFLKYFQVYKKRSLAIGQQKWKENVNHCLTPSEICTTCRLRFRFRFHYHRSFTNHIESVSRSLWIEIECNRSRKSDLHLQFSILLLKYTYFDLNLQWFILHGNFFPRSQCTLRANIVAIKKIRIINN